MHPEYAPFGSADESLLAHTLRNSCAIRGLTGREQRRDAERQARKAAKSNKQTNKKNS